MKYRSIYNSILAAVVFLVCAKQLLPGQNVMLGYRDDATENLLYPSEVSIGEIRYLDGLNGNIQTQLDGKVANDGTGLITVGSGIGLDFRTPDGGGNIWQRVGFNASHYWDLVYNGATTGTGGNELKFLSGETGKYLQMDHDMNLEVWDGATLHTLYHSGNLPSFQPADADLNYWAGFTPSVNIQALLAQSNSGASNKEFRMDVSNTYEGQIRWMENDLFGMGIRYHATNNTLSIDRYVNSATPTGSIFAFRDTGNIEMGEGLLLIDDVNDLVVLGDQVVTVDARNAEVSFDAVADFYEDVTVQGNAELLGGAFLDGSNLGGVGELYVDYIEVGNAVIDNNGIGMGSGAVSWKKSGDANYGVSMAYNSTTNKLEFSSYNNSTTPTSTPLAISTYGSIFIDGSSLNISSDIAITGTTEFESDVTFFEQVVMDGMMMLGGVDLADVSENASDVTSEPSSSTTIVTNKALTEYASQVIVSSVDRASFSSHTSYETLLSITIPAGKWLIEGNFFVSDPEELGGGHVLLQWSGNDNISDPYLTGYWIGRTELSGAEIGGLWAISSNTAFGFSPGDSFSTPGIAFCFVSQVVDLTAERTLSLVGFSNIDTSGEYYDVDDSFFRATKLD